MVLQFPHKKYKQYNRMAEARVWEYKLPRKGQGFQGKYLYIFPRKENV